MLNGIVKVEKQDDGFVFTNPGLLKLPIEQIFVGGESKARNQRMQNMFRMIGYGENLGSGFPLIVHAWDEKHWMKPELIEQPDFLQVKLRLYVHNNVHNNNLPKFNQLTERQRDIINYIRLDSTITIVEMSCRLKLSAKTVQRDLEALRSVGVISREGSKNAGRWVISEIDL